MPTLIISFDNGKFSVKGPLQDRLTCYGLLEMARDVIAKQAVTEETPRIEVPDVRILS